MDACSLILLAKASVLETILSAYTISITNNVFEEVMKGKAKMSTDALLLERLYNEKKMSVISADNTLTKKIMTDFNMGKGEASTIAVGLKEKDSIVATDNRQGRKAALVNGLPLIGSVEMIVSLYKRKKIDKHKATASLKILQEEGWFDSYLIEKAMEDLK